MIRHVIARFTLALLCAAGCSRDTAQRSNAGGDSSDLARSAVVRAVELANASQTYQPVRFVSDIEQVGTPTVKRDHDDVVVRDGHDSLHVEAVEVPMLAPDSVAPAVPIDSTAMSASEPRVPFVVARSAPLPAVVAGRVSNWRPPERGPEFDTVIGVVLRGGSVDPGHCVPQRRPPSQIPGRPPR